MTNTRLRLAVPDMISPSYFPAIAAVQLGYTEQVGLDVDLELHFPVTEAVAGLAAGDLDFLAGAAHSPAYLSDGWDRVVLLSAVSQHMYWFLVVRKDLGPARGRLDGLGGLRIGAAPGPDVALIHMLEAAGIDIFASGIQIVPVRGVDARSISFGVTAARALAAGTVDGFWANGMGARVAVDEGTGTVVVDARRGDGPSGTADLTFAALMTSRRLLDTRPSDADRMAEAVSRAQAALAANPSLARRAAAPLFPAMETELIESLIAADAPFYSPEISDDSVNALDRFVTARGLSSIGSRRVTAVAGGESR